MFVSCLMATGLIIVERGVILRFQGFKRFGNFFFFYVCFVFNRDRINYYGSIIKLI